MTLGRFVTLAVVLALLGLISGLAIGNHAMGVLHPEETLAFSVPQRQPLDPTRQTYLELGQFVIPVVYDGKTQAFVLAEITLSMTSLDEKMVAARHIPDYRDATIRSLFSYAETGAFMSGQFDPKALAERMANDLNTAFGAEVVDKVLFTRLMLQNNYRS
jgi:flagellar basal body-associated protein FliL